MLRIIVALVALLLSSQSMAESWDIENYPAGTEVPYKEGVTLHLELLPVCRNDEVAWITRGNRKPPEYVPDMLKAVFKQKTVRIAEGDRAVNITFRDVDTSIGAMLPVLDMHHKVIGHITPNKVGANTLTFANVSLQGPIAIVTPVSFWNRENPGFEVHANFSLYHNPASGNNIKSEKGELRELINRGWKWTLVVLVTDC